MEEGRRRTLQSTSCRPAEHSDRVEWGGPTLEGHGRGDEEEEEEKDHFHKHLLSLSSVQSLCWTFEGY